MAEEKVAEYKRTCNECGKVWHSLVGREASLDPNNWLCCDQDRIGECSTCGEISGRSAQYGRNIQSREDSLSQLRRCPDCHSNNFREEIIYYTKV